MSDLLNVYWNVRDYECTDDRTQMFHSAVFIEYFINYLNDMFTLFGHGLFLAQELFLKMNIIILSEHIIAFVAIH